jgi:hypothetical protein
VEQAVGMNRLTVFIDLAVLQIDRLPADDATRGGYGRWIRHKTRILLSGLNQV